MTETKTVPKNSLWRTIRAVAWSFMGIRKKSDSLDDGVHITLFHIIGVGLVGGLLFVVSLIALVNWVVAK
jgi:nitrate reductase NapE component